MSLSPFSPNQSISVESTVVVEPIYTALTAMSLLTAPNLSAEDEPWLVEVASKLSAKERESNRIIFEWFGAALMPRANHISFGNIVTALEEEPPTKLRDRIVQAWIDGSHDENVTQRKLLADEQFFMAFAEARDSEQPIESELLPQVFDLISEPAALHKCITTHLRTLWENEFASEWKSKVSMMNYCAEELNGRSWPSDSALAVLRAFIRGQIPDYITTQLSGIRQINIAPSPFIHLYASKLYTSEIGAPDTLWLFMLADFWQLPMRTEPIKRGEVKGPASALADETRLQILELLAAHGELRAQEIIARLEASQSTVSRHLKQLSSAQFISEKRAGDANKIYQLNPGRVSEFAHTLSGLISKENAQLILNDIRLDMPAELQPYLDRSGLVTQWPAKWKNQEAVLDYLIEKFEPGKKYTEKQVNEVLNEWHTYEDPVYLRRALIETRQLLRTPNGAEYWRSEE